MSRKIHGAAHGLAEVGTGWEPFRQEAMGSYWLSPRTLSPFQAASSEDRETGNSLHNSNVKAPHVSRSGAAQAM